MLREGRSQGELMAGWGRNAALDAVGQAQPRYIRRAFLCAVLAFAIVIASFIFMLSLPTDASEQLSDIATMTVVISYLGVAPALHVAGMVFGVLGIRHGQGRFWGFLAILLNVALVGIGALLGMAALSSMGAYT